MATRHREETRPPGWSNQEGATLPINASIAHVRLAAQTEQKDASEEIEEKKTPTNSVKEWRKSLFLPFSSFFHLFHCFFSQTTRLIGLEWINWTTGIPNTNLYWRMQGMRIFIPWSLQFGNA